MLTGKRMRKKEYDFLFTETKNLRAEVRAAYDDNNYNECLRVAGKKLLDADKTLIRQWKMSRKVELAQICRDYIIDFNYILFACFLTELSGVQSYEQDYISLIREEEKGLGLLQPNRRYSDEQEHKSICLCWSLQEVHFYYIILLFHDRYKDKHNISESQINHYRARANLRLKQTQNYYRTHTYKCWRNKQFDLGFSKAEIGWLLYLERELEELN